MHIGAVIAAVTYQRVWKLKVGLRVPEEVLFRAVWNPRVRSEVTDDACAHRHEGPRVGKPLKFNKC